ncbi:MAG TPA: hypothetical protein VFB45_08080 [Pseudolabrys sp.]|nr:hypothetical protein [Pseudolabrys sp.]
MTNLRAAVLLALGLGVAGILPTPASAGSYFDTVCNCRRPESEFNSRRVVHEAPRVLFHTRVVNTERVVPREHLIQENRLVVHVRPVINKEVIVHRENVLVKNIILHKLNTTNKFVEEARNVVEHRNERGSVREITEHREVRGVNCNCGFTGERSVHVSSYRD